MTPWSLKERAIRSLERNGVVRPSELVEAARDEGHPCHGDFTWDVGEASVERWRDQARALIRRVTFEVIVEDYGQSVVNYVPGPDSDEAVFVSVPKLRGKAKVLSMLSSEVAMLHGLSSRVYGLALSKTAIVGADTVQQLQAVKDQLAALKADLSDE